jgi:hypothetical protein
MERMHRLGVSLVEGVRVMDAEASTLLHGHPAGLYGYRSHIGSKKRKYEDVWSERLVALLIEQGWNARSQESFRGQRAKKCDISVELEEGKLAWIEVKPAWKGWFDRKADQITRKNAFYSPYLFGPLKPGLKKSHSAAQDIAKLDAFSSGEPAALLLIAFDVVGCVVDGDVREFQDPRAAECTKVARTDP